MNKVSYFWLGERLFTCAYTNAVIEVRANFNMKPGDYAGYRDRFEALGLNWINGFWLPSEGLWCFSGTPVIWPPTTVNSIVEEKT